jgi:hypothetical protein
MRRRWQVAAVVVLVAALAWAALRLAQDAAAGDLRRPTRVYQLDSGQFVRTWLDEPVGLLCVAIIGQDGVAPAGISCVPLGETTYGWAVGAPAR